MNSKAGDLQQRAEARIGKVLRDKWRLERLLGLGGMAAVYLATHRNGKQVAIKILHPEAALVPDIRARFQREGYLANKVNHPGAVSILDDDMEDDGTVFLVMELLTGETLDARWAREGTLSWELVLVLAYKLLDVLSAAHEKNIIHRDLKPANVFLDRNGAVKILDFGIARLQSLSSTGNATLRDTALGTPGFMPPEQARGHWDRVDAVSDLWAVGANMFALISGRHVHEGTTVNEQLLAAMTAPAAPLCEVAAQVPAAVAKIVDRALAFDKSARFTSAQAMQQELRSVYEELTGKSIEQSLPMPLYSRAAATLGSIPTVMATLNEATSSRSLRRNSSVPQRSRALKYTLIAVVLAGVAAAIGLSAKERRSNVAAAGRSGASSINTADTSNIAVLTAPAPTDTAQKVADSRNSVAPKPVAAMGTLERPTAPERKPLEISKTPTKSARPVGSFSKNVVPPPAASVTNKPVTDDDDFFDRRK